MLPSAPTGFNAPPGDITTISPNFATLYSYNANISISQETMRRKGFTPYGPSKAALESMSTILAQDLAGTGITLNILLPGGATNTGMIPDSFPESRRKDLIDPQVMGPPAVYLASDDAREINGQRIVATEFGKG